MWFHLNEISGIGKSIEIESRIVVDRSWEDGGLGVTAKRCRGSFWGSENVLKLTGVMDAAL